MTVSDKLAVATVLATGLWPYPLALALHLDAEYRRPFLKAATRYAFRFARKLHKLSVKAGN